MLARPPKAPAAEATAHARGRAGSRDGGTTEGLEVGGVVSALGEALRGCLAGGKTLGCCIAGGRRPHC